jgi:hypothetical protein
LINRSPAAIAIGRLFQPQGKALAILKGLESPRLPEDHPLIRLAKGMQREHEQELESARAAPRGKRKGIGGPKPVLTPEIIEKAKAAYLKNGPSKLEADLAYLRDWFKLEGVPCPSDSTIIRRIINPNKPRR